MNTLIRFYRSLYLSPLAPWLLAGVVALWVLAFFIPAFTLLAKGALLALLLAAAVDMLMLYQVPDGVQASRSMAERFSNGDPNPVQLQVENRYPFPVRLTLWDEVPEQFQLRDASYALQLRSGESHTIAYSLRPVTRGEYHFGNLNLFAGSPLGIWRRRYDIESAAMVPVYPSYLQVRQYQFMAVSHRLQEAGIKRIRRIGHSSEFEQIKDYVNGDDYRSVNWKATARAGRLMVNQFADERAQHVYCLIDKSRAMKMPFEGMTLLDYAINTALVMSYVALYRQDKAGLITFAERIGNVLPASNRFSQMNLIQEALYNQQTRFLEADYERLYALLRSRLNQRSLLLLFTNFETLSAMRRQLPYLQKIAAAHRLVLVFFENTELQSLLHSTPADTAAVYAKATGEQFALEKKLIVRELEQYGIHAVLTAPQQLSVNTINKYLEIKARGLL